MILISVACDSTITDTKINENKEEIIASDKLKDLDLSALLEANGSNIQDLITMKGERTEFHPDSLRAWAERSRKEMTNSEVQLMNSPADLPCVILPDGSEECHDGPPIHPDPGDPDPGDPTPPCAGNPFNDMGLFVSNEIFVNPANIAEIIFLVTTGASKSITEIWVGAMAYVDGTQFFGDLYWEYNSDFAAIGVALFNHPSYSLFELEGIHQWNEEDCIGGKYSVFDYTYTRITK